MKKLLKVFIVISMMTIALAVIFIILYDKSYAYQLEIYAKNEAKNRLNNEINRMILEEIDLSKITYEDIISFEKNSEGNILCVNANMTTVNILKNKLDIRISELCSNNKFYEAEIPVGNLFGGGLVYGKGFNVTVRFRPIGESTTKISGQLKECGINQSLYRVSFDIDIKAAVVLPFRYIEIPLKIETIISETVLLGKVPDSFTYFSVDDEVSNSDLQGYIEDFKAE